MTRVSLSALIASTLAAAVFAGPALAAAPKAAKAAPALPDLSAEQIATSERVLTGPIGCEMNQSVDVKAGDKPGYVKLTFKGRTYTLVPEATTSGAVRLEDKKAGVVWLQIANKSMLMNAKIGQRMVDGCVHDKQKT
jgi:hypothetical protein